MSCRRAEADSGPIWLDNFSRNYGNRYLRNAISPFASCQWSVVGKHVIGQTLQKLHNEDGIYMSALPQDLYENAALVTSSFKSICIDDEFTSTDSFVVRYGLHCCPPGIPKEKMGDHKEVQRTFSVSNSSIKDRSYTFCPLSIEPENVGSNLGLLQMIGKIHKDQQRAKVGTWCWILSDINIFNRILKVFVLTFLSVNVSLLTAAMVSTISSLTTSIYHWVLGIVTKCFANVAFWYSQIFISVHFSTNCFQATYFGQSLQSLYKLSSTSTTH